MLENLSTLEIPRILLKFGLLLLKPQTIQSSMSRSFIEARQTSASNTWQAIHKLTNSNSIEEVLHIQLREVRVRVNTRAFNMYNLSQ